MITATIKLTSEQIKFLRGTIYEYTNQWDEDGNKIQLTPEETIIYNELKNILEWVAEDTVTD
jgi:hypothetical protein